MSGKNPMVFILIASVIGNIFLASRVLTVIAQNSKTNVELPFLSKRIFVENQNDILINFVDLRTQLRYYVESRAERTGVYFEYLPSGVSIGVGEKEEYLLASLLKVPLVMAVYKEIEHGTVTKDTVLVMSEQHIDKQFGDFWTNGVGAKITVREAIELVLTKSDNTAKNMLADVISLDKMENVFDYLDIPKVDEYEGPVVTPKNYSSVLRSLYLSSYLPKELSNEVLETLTTSVHKDKLVAGIPDHIKVAHKIGVYKTADSLSPEVYTDCGIIYEPQRPYILCVMTESNEQTAIEIISDISKMVYTFVHSANK